MLAYGYAVLESQVQMAVVAAGLDPTIGFMHAHGERRSALVLDLMEPMRPVVDAVVLGLARDHTFSPADFMVRDDGICRVAPQLAMKLAHEVTGHTDAVIDVEIFAATVVNPANTSITSTSSPRRMQIRCKQPR